MGDAVGLGVARELRVLCWVGPFCWATRGITNVTPRPTANIEPIIFIAWILVVTGCLLPAVLKLIKALR